MEPGFFRKTFGVWSIKIGFKCTSQSGLRYFYKPCLEKFERNIWAPIPTQWYENTSGCNTEDTRTTSMTLVSHS